MSNLEKHKIQKKIEQINRPQRERLQNIITATKLQLLVRRCYFREYY